MNSNKPSKEIYKAIRIGAFSNFDIPTVSIGNGPVKIAIVNGIE